MQVNPTTGLQSSRVKPYTLSPPRATNEIWKRGWKIPQPSIYPIGCRRPVKLFDLPTQEFHFRLVHPQFGKFFDKWQQKDINWDDLRNHDLMKKDLEGLIDKVWEANSVRKPLPNRPLAKRTLIRPNPFTAFLEKEVLMAHLAEKRFLDKLNFAKDPKGAQERLEQGKDRYSLKIVEYYHNALKEQQQMFQDERNAKIAAAKVKREAEAMRKKVDEGI